MSTEIKTLQNPAKTKAYLPRTCIKAIADKNGQYLDEDLVKSDIDALKNGKIASIDSAITSLIVSGSDYIRLADGTQICWGSDSISASSVTAGKEFNHASISFPQAFVSVPRMSLTPRGYAGTFYSVGFAPSATDFTYSIKATYSFPDGTTYQDWIAIGRWK